MTIIPNLLVTGILAILFSLMYVVWAIGFAQRKHGGLVLMMLSVVMLPVGAGIFPPILGMILGVIATTINAPLTCGVLISQQISVISSKRCGRGLSAPA